MGHSKIVALSGSSKETAAYGIAIGKKLRHIANRDTMRSQGFGVTEIHYLPGWNKRRDRHAVASAVQDLQRARRRSPIIEKYIVRLQDGRFVDQDYRGPELEAMVDTQKTQLDGLRQMHVHESLEEALDVYTPPAQADPQPPLMAEDVFAAEARAAEDIQDAMEEHDAEITHLPQTIDAEEAAEENGMDVEEFFDFLDGDKGT